MTDEYEWRDYRKRMNILNNAAYAAVGVCPHKYPHPTFKALVKIAHEIDALIDDETWGRDNMPPAEWTAAGGLKSFCKQQGEK